MDTFRSRQDWSAMVVVSAASLFVISCAAHEGLQRWCDQSTRHVKSLKVRKVCWAPACKRSSETVELILAAPV